VVLPSGFTVASSLILYFLSILLLDRAVALAIYRFSLFCFGLVWFVETSGMKWYCKVKNGTVL
jgi:hypothetical protein